MAMQGGKMKKEARKKGASLVDVALTVCDHLG